MRIHFDKKTTLPNADKRQIGNAYMFNSSPVVANGTGYAQLDRTFVSVPIAAASVDSHVFIATKACEVRGIREIHTAAGGSGAAVRARKCTGTTVPGSGAALHTADFDLTATANTVQTGTLTATAADLVLAAGNTIALDFTGTLTALLGVVTIELRLLNHT
jgi:hypothetical protein